jgi:hypothetical protein
VDPAQVDPAKVDPAKKIDPAKVDPAKKVDPPKAAERPKATRPTAPVEAKRAPTTTVAVAAAPGTLTVSATPPCEVLIDGAGYHTPIRGMKLPAGKHKIVLVNAELGVNETIGVEIKAGGTESIDRDYSDRVKKPEPPVEPKKVDPPKSRDGTINPFGKKP